MSQLKQTTDELVNQLQKAEAVIDAVSRRLEDEFSERFSKSTTVSAFGHHASFRFPKLISRYENIAQLLCVQVNPMLLAKRLQKVAA